jgi:DNA-binding response OmpR family regulator
MAIGVEKMANDRILIVEDDARLRQVMAEYLQSEGYIVLEAGDGTLGLRLWAEATPDLIILDWMLPGQSGLDVARQVRAKAATPIIMLTARSEEPDIVVGLEMGADDYLVKPVSLRQLVARIRAVLRRTRPDPAANDRIDLGDVAVDLAGHTVLRDGQTVALTGTQFKLLAVLARNPGRVFSRLQLMEAAIGDYYEGYERTIDSHISHLRRKLGVDDLIQTVHGIGYKLVPPKR